MRKLLDVLKDALRPDELVLLCPDCAELTTFQAKARGDAGSDPKNARDALEGGDLGSAEGGCMKEHDPVNHPKHYTDHPSGIECIQITEHMGFNLGNAVKYIWRCDLKKDAIEDLEKAVWYINREIQKRKGA